jgi:hypothetical protein
MSASQRNEINVKAEEANGEHGFRDYKISVKREMLFPLPPCSVKINNTPMTRLMSEKQATMRELKTPSRDKPNGKAPVPASS